MWDEATSQYLDPGTGEVLPTWDQALDAIALDDAPLHVARFGAKFDAQGVLAGSKAANRCIRYLTKYLTGNNPWSPGMRGRTTAAEKPGAGLSW